MLILSIELRRGVDQVQGNIDYFLASCSSPSPLPSNSPASGRGGLALRHKFLVYYSTYTHQNSCRLRLQLRPTRFGLGSSGLGPIQRSALSIVKTRGPFITWHRQGFRLSWKWKAELVIVDRRLRPEVQRPDPKISSADRAGARLAFMGRLLKLGVPPPQRQLPNTSLATGGATPRGT